MNLSPNDITILPRQRSTDLEVTYEFVASIKKRVIHPIVLRRNPDDQILLVVGERRLTAMKLAEIDPLIEGTHFRFLNDLSDRDAKIAELEENVKRLDIHWRDQVRAFHGLHELFLEENKKWTTYDTARELNVTQSHVSTSLMVFRNLDKPVLQDANSTRHAYEILRTISERQTVIAVETISALGKQAFRTPSQTKEANYGPYTDLTNRIMPSFSTTSLPLDSTSLLPGRNSLVAPTNLDTSPNNHLSDGPIRNLDFHKWIAEYSGDKFTLIHCDFPYDVDYSSYAHSHTSKDSAYDHSFWPLMDTLLNNIDKLASYSSHLMIWFGMEFYQKTKSRLEEAGLFVHAHPFVWLKSDNAGIIPGQNNLYPRRIYETAFLCSRGRRPLVRQKSNAHSAPTANNAIHTSQKSVAVLRHFFSMLIDETTRVLDPACRSGSAIIAAEFEGAKEVVGLEINSEYTKAANANVLAERRKRILSHAT